MEGVVPRCWVVLLLLDASVKFLFPTYTSASLFPLLLRATNSKEVGKVGIFLGAEGGGWEKGVDDLSRKSCT